MITDTDNYYTNMSGLRWFITWNQFMKLNSCLFITGSGPLLCIPINSTCKGHAYQVWSKLVASFLRGGQKYEYKLCIKEEDFLKFNNIFALNFPDT